MNPAEKELDELFTEMRGETLSTETKGKFETLPDGEYIGRVHIAADTVSNPNSLNAGRKKYVIRLTVTEGDEKGKMAYNHRIILPHNLANKPADEKALESWRKQAKEYLRKTDEILGHCGVDTTDTDMNRFVLKIAENNRRNPIVNFTMKSGVAYVNRLIRKDDPATDDEDSLFSDKYDLPNGNDVPLK